ncbi:hypothetical protein COU20_00725 [Candidatus Kaiserbacteria bacterium CG10_big_fil_rev_8_21_14_0_10_59_10]|uniref:Uncharacterized protein n=1 Tax=Candidatus Kaiserbacteria bacterium CG10_big_fil_rev_8_21_14_0_10_59_10 TaxID=1974612 RepID=A0A2H0U8F9_9BACT|nr:MAG: hypothetical protein COU20_00725 [Candidatus Kaiserbacteria bacterium CG10_big_fil_rev_8_21_14_0_10_59_10]
MHSAFGAARLAPQRQGPTEPRFRPFNFKKNPPAKKKKHGKAERGEGGRADQREARGGVCLVCITTRAERTKKFQATTHAERAPVRLWRKVSRHLWQNRF